MQSMVFGKFDALTATVRSACSMCSVMSTICSICIHGSLKTRAVVQVLNGGSEAATPGAKWAAPAGSGLGSTGPSAGGVPIRCRPSVSRHAAAAAAGSTDAEAAQNMPPPRGTGGDTTPRKQERPQPPELLRFLAGWGLPTLSTFR